MKSIFFINEVLSAEKEIIDTLRIPSIVLMENAGLNSAKYLIYNFKDKLSTRIIILTGKGNNAGDGFVISRHLSIHGVKTYVLKLYPASELQGDAKVNFEILENLNSDLIKIQNLD